MKAIFDTNILIDYLKGIEAARDELARYQNPLISLITWMEVLVGARDDADFSKIQAFLQNFGRVGLSDAIAQHAVTLRRQHRIRLPDAIIWATALNQEGLLVTRNTRDFPTQHPEIRVPYQLK